MPLLMPMLAGVSLAGCGDRLHQLAVPVEMPEVERQEAILLELEAKMALEARDEAGVRFASGPGELTIILEGKDAGRLHVLANECLVELRRTYPLPVWVNGWEWKAVDGD